MDFKSLDLSPKTLKGLQEANYVKPTDIQVQSLPFSLKGKDVLGAAKTGSGKTLAFIIPVLEKLYAGKWSHMDGLGAVIISPTRELALQIFAELRKVGKNHTFSAGLLIGGKDLKQEQQRISKMNILVCTPGRLLQHMDQTPEFETLNIQILVLDEADRIMDQGFQREMNAIIEHLPKERQTLLFSATQTKSVSDLARLSLRDSEYVAVHEGATTSTPAKLVQKYIKCPLPMKLDILFSFIRTHLKSKILVFLSSCKQVRFVFEAFCKMQPGMPLMCLHGKQKQQKRMAIFQQFCKKTEACLFATDIAARGLDFPAVDWVLQLDCPEDTATYIHRVGRTARYNAAGQALLLLIPSEIAFVEKLEKASVPITEIKVNPARTTSVKNSLGALLSESPDLKYLAQKSFICYVRSIHLQKDKDVFSVEELPVEAYAESLGLPGAPKIRFLKKSAEKNASRQLALVDDSEIADMPSSDKPAIKSKSKVDKMFEKKNITVLSEHYQKLINDSASDSDESHGFLTMKRQDHEIDDSIPIVEKPKKKLSKKALIKKMERGKKVVFDDDGEAHDPHKLASLTEFTPVDLEKMKEEHRSATITGMKNVDKVDKEEERVKRKLKKQEKKHKERALRRIEVIFALTKSGPVTGVTLASPEATASASEYESDHSVEQEKPSKKLKTLEHMNTQSLQDLALQLLDE